MELQLSSTKVKELSINNSVDSNDVVFGYRLGFSEDEKKIFAVEFDLSISDENEGYTLHVVYEAIFTTKEDLNKEFIETKFARVNAPAIAFPYLRAFISIITQQSGYDTIVLPSFNFVKLSEKNINN